MVRYNRARDDGGLRPRTRVFGGASRAARLMARPVILVIEDQPLVQELVSDTVAEFGFDVRVAGTAAEAFAVLQSERPAVILLDIGLPDAVGTSTLEWLQTLRPDIPVIVLTGNTDQRLARQMRQRGAFDYITKPFEVEHLERALQAAVSTASR
jgi:CheY-like chemotaxis protein